MIYSGWFEPENIGTCFIQNFLKSNSILDVSAPNWEMDCKLEVQAHKAETWKKIEYGNLSKKSIFWENH